MDRIGPSGAEQPAPGQPHQQVSHVGRGRPFHGRVFRRELGHALTADHTPAQVGKRVPEGVFCLLTALRFHELTTQSPAEVWIALPEKARRPLLDYPRLRVARFSGAALTEGIEEHRVEGVTIRVYSAAKTVADCFKYRNRIGIDVAVEALWDYSRRYRGGADDLAWFARICRVSRVMQPYLDSIARRRVPPVADPRPLIGNNKVVEVRTVDLSKTADGVLTDISGIADRIQAIASRTATTAIGLAH